MCVPASKQTSRPPPHQVAKPEGLETSALQALRSFSSLLCKVEQSSHVLKEWISNLAKMLVNASILRLSERFLSPEGKFLGALKECTSTLVRKLAHAIFLILILGGAGRGP